MTPAQSMTRFAAARRMALAMGVAVTATLLAVPVVSAERLTDDAVKQLLERIDNERDRFEDQLDGKLKRSVLRGPGGEVNVERYLDDLQANVKKLRERFTTQYAASSEVTTVLRQASDIDRYMSTQPPNFDGASEWKRLAASLGELAGVYGTAMPIREGQQARRMNDGEVKKAATDLEKSADQFRKALDSALKNDKSVDKATREGHLAEAEGLKEDAKQLASRVGDGRPASGEAQALLDRAAKLKGATSGFTLPAPAQTAWSSIQSGLDKIDRAFNPAAPPR